MASDISCFNKRKEVFVAAGAVLSRKIDRLNKTWLVEADTQDSVKILYLLKVILVISMIPSVLWLTMTKYLACKKYQTSNPQRFLFGRFQGIQPNLEWSRENRPVKQKMEVIVAAAAAE